MKLTERLIKLGVVMFLIIMLGLLTANIVLLAINKAAVRQLSAHPQQQEFLIDMAKPYFTTIIQE